MMYDGCGVTALATTFSSSGAECNRKDILPVHLICDSVKDYTVFIRYILTISSIHSFDPTTDMS